MSPDGLSLLVVGYKGIARVVEKSTGVLRFELPPETDAPDGGFLFRGTFSPDGRFIAVARSDRRLRVWAPRLVNSWEKLWFTRNL